MIQVGDDMSSGPAQDPKHPPTPLSLTTQKKHDGIFWPVMRF